MFSPRVKLGIFGLEGANAFAMTLFSYYLFFHMHERFGFSNEGNLALSATNGIVYAVSAWFAGQFAQRHGYFFSLRLGWIIMAAGLVGAAAICTVTAHFLTLALWTVGMSFTWPALEAIISEHEPQARLQRLVGVYNVVWASGSGLAYFFGGALLEKLGSNSIFFIPLAIHLAQLAGLAWLERPTQPAGRWPNWLGRLPVTVAPPEQTVVPPATFLRMAWLANPFAYVAISALVPVIPKLAEHFHLSPMLAGFLCSLWLFARVLAFAVLGLWTGWHYRFAWLAGAFCLLIGSFVTILASRTLEVLLIAQLAFGFAIGLLYYSSLFYSMDVGETKGSHGGFHEAAIGIGIFAGPALGAAALRYYPTHPNAHAWAVTGLLLVGFVALLGVRYRPGRSRVLGDLRLDRTGD